MKNRIYLIVTLSMIILVTACGAPPTRTTKTGTVPNDLQTIEAAAEDIIDFAPSDNWDKISADVTDIESAWKSYESQAEKDGAPQEIQDAMNSALTQLQAASASKDPAATMQASNDVSAAVVELFALYSPKVPADIGRLDVLERQVILDVARQDYGAAEMDLSQTKSTWERVKASAVEQNGEEIVMQFEASLAAQESALAAKEDSALTDEARAALEIVDSLERLY
jgi:hypothetical protein